jgi:heat shock protein HtpX
MRDYSVRAAAWGTAEGGGLQVRMAIALVLGFGLLLSIVAFLLYLALFTPDGWSIGATALFFVFAGAVFLRRRQGRLHPGAVPADGQRRLRRAAERLAVVADRPVPKTAVIPDAAPLSWTASPLGRPPTIHVTTGLLDRLEDRELEAVVAHELGHIVHRDAVVVTLLAGPPAAFFEALAEIRRRNPLVAPFTYLVLMMFYGLPALVLDLLSRLVSRHRELAADRAAALLTGSAAAVGAALIAVDDGLQRERRRDLRRLAQRDTFHFVPVRVRRGLGRLWATHPPLHKRVQRMERLETGLQR